MFLNGNQTVVLPETFKCGGKQQLGLLVTLRFYSKDTTQWLISYSVISYQWNNGNIAVFLDVTPCSMERRIPVYQTTGCHVPLLPVTDRNDYRGYCHLGCGNVWFGTQVKVKGKVHPITGHEGPEGE
jgi:hypothetical protein